MKNGPYWLFSTVKAKISKSTTMLTRTASHAAANMADTIPINPAPSQKPELARQPPRPQTPQRRPQNGRPAERVRRPPRRPPRLPPRNPLPTCRAVEQTPRSDTSC